MTKFRFSDQIYIFTQTIAVFGPTLPDLMHQTNNTISDYGYLIFARQGGSLFGTLGAAFLGKVDKTFGLTISLFWTGIASVFIPYSQTLWQLGAIGFLAKAGLGVVNVFSNVTALHLWAGNGANFLFFEDFSGYFGLTAT